MNPQTPLTPEQLPTAPMAEIPAAPEITPTAPAQAASVTPAVPAAQTPAGTPVQADPIVAAATPAPTGGPQIAADVDVIEKEWVDKASEVIAKTAGDPHAEEEAIEELQVDYMKKRYGKDVAKSND